MENFIKNYQYCSKILQFLNVCLLKVKTKYNFYFFSSISSGNYCKRINFQKLPNFDFHIITGIENFKSIALNISKSFKSKNLAYLLCNMYLKNTFSIRFLSLGF